MRYNIAKIIRDKDLEWRNSIDENSYIDDEPPIKVEFSKKYSLFLADHILISILGSKLLANLIRGWIEDNQQTIQTSATSLWGDSLANYILHKLLEEE